MDDVFDLFGDPVLVGLGKRGRSQHIHAQETHNKFKLLVALGRIVPMMAAALGVTGNALHRIYSRTRHGRRR